MLRCLLLVVLFFTFQLGFAQIDLYHKGFIPPVDIPVYLSGNFGELRSTHFHTGIDIKTLGRTGLPIYAIGDGYLARVFVSPGGYGKALYINHPNGKTSVYGHLDGFSEKVDSVVKRLQYYNENFSLNHFLKSGEIEFLKGEIIGLSGNSGSSGGPHLHFEIRNTKTERALNPLHFNMPVKDETRPQISGIKLFPIPGKGSLNFSNTARYYPAVFYGNAFHLKGSPKINVYGELGIGIETFDYLTGDWSKCGSYSASLYVDDVLTFCWKLDSLSFDENRFIKTVCDYKTRVNERRWVIKMFRDEPNNRFSNYCTQNDGKIRFTNEGEHTIKLIVHDVYGNQSDIAFRVEVKKTAILPHSPRGMLFCAWDEISHFRSENIDITFPKGALYDDIFLNMKSEKSSDLWSNIYEVHYPDVAVHKPYTIAIKPNKNHSVDKLYIAEISKSGRPVGFVGRGFKDGKVVGSPRSFSRFAIAKDTIPPTIRSLDVAEGRAIYGKKQLRFKIDDAESGIASYRGEINGNWILMDYDSKNKLLVYDFDSSRLEKGKTHKLFLKTEDNTGNVSVYLCNFKW